MPCKIRERNALVPASSLHRRKKTNRRYQQASAEIFHVAATEASFLAADMWSWISSYACSALGSSRPSGGFSGSASPPLAIELCWSAGLPLQLLTLAFALLRYSIRKRNTNLIRYVFIRLGFRQKSQRRAALVVDECSPPARHLPGSRLARSQSQRFS